MTPSRRIILSVLQEEAARYELKLDSESMTPELARKICMQASARTGLSEARVQTVLDQQRLGNVNSA